MKEYKLIGKAVYLVKWKILVVADLHLGYEESIMERGIFLPREQFSIIKKELERILKKIGRVNEIVILGDLKHNFSGVLGQEWKEGLELIEFLAEKCGKIVLVRGNHDTILPSGMKNKIEMRNFYVKGENVFVHGDKYFAEVLDRKIKKIFLGHKHPAITLRKGVKSEKYKCFLVGRWKGREIIILPSFFPLVEGSGDYNNQNLAYKFNLKKFRVYAVVPDSTEVLEMGKRGEIKTCD